MNVGYKVYNRYQRHKDKWQACQRCLLSETRSRVCIGRGRLPCDCLFIGEAPGQVEDVRGEPFIGPAGRLLDRWIAEVDVKFTWAITNIVGCAPFDETKPGKLRKPTTSETNTCLPKINEFLRMACPIVVVLLGKVARRYYPCTDNLDDFVLSGPPTLDLVHPAHTLRVGGFGSQESREQIEMLSEFLEENIR